MKVNEDSRVKLPAIVHRMRMGYQYLSLKDQSWDLDTNIFPDLFKSVIGKINPGIQSAEASRLLDDVKLLLDNEDLGRAFFERLSERSNTKLIDFENFENNSFKKSSLGIKNLSSKRFLSPGIFTAFLICDLA